MDEDKLDSIVERDGRVFLEPEGSDKRVPLIQVFEHYEVRNLEARETADLLGLEESEVREGINYLHSSPDVYSSFEESVEDFSAEDHVLNMVSRMRDEEPRSPDLEPVDGWKYLGRDMGSLALWNKEESTGDTAHVNRADTVFTDYYERGMEKEEIAEKTGLMDEQVSEVIEYAEQDTENMHELARSAYEKRKMIEQATGDEVEKMMVRAIEEDDEFVHVEYAGVLGDLQDLIEEEVDGRGFKVRYDPSEQETHRNSMEIHVLQGKDADEEFYFGADEGSLYFGSTVSEVDKRIRDIEDALPAIRQEMNAMVLEERKKTHNHQ
jgi:hypothetical protein